MRDALYGIVFFPFMQSWIQFLVGLIMFLLGLGFFAGFLLHRDRKKGRVQERFAKKEPSESRINDFLRRSFYLSLFKRLCYFVEVGFLFSMENSLHLMFYWENTMLDFDFCTRINFFRNIHFWFFRYL